MKDTSSKTLPKARAEGLIVQKLPDEVLVYDTDKDQVHCLNETVSRVWNYCDGKTSLEQMRERLEQDLLSPVSEGVVRYALDELGRHLLLEGTSVTARFFPSATRREFVRDFAKTALVAIPVILTVTAPTRAQAASCVASGQPCSNNGTGGLGQCCTNNCPTNVGTCP